MFQGAHGSLENSNDDFLNEFCIEILSFPMSKTFICIYMALYNRQFNKFILQKLDIEH